MLKTAKIATDTTKKDEAGLNDLVEIYFLEDDETETYKLVTSIRGNSLDNRISIESPLGKAILGHKAGETVLVQVNDSVSYPVEIRSIQEADGEDDIRSF